jgi:hypothetical protein
MATQPNAPYYFNTPDGATLKGAFSQIASDLAHSTAHLIQLYPAPVVTSAGGATSSVAITGNYLTGANSVTFGGKPSTYFTVNNDNSITAQAPTGTSGSSVDVIVTTPGGGSAVTSLDKYTYP